jgi:predicted porin
MPYVGVDFDLNDKATVGASYLYIATAEDLGEDKDLGHEVSVRASYKVAKGLTTGIEAGYLIGGDAWDTLASDDDGDDVIRTNANVRFQF